jgi:hypothetical protein
MPLKNDWQNGDLFTPAAANDMADVVNAYGPPTATGQSLVTAASAAAARTAMGAATPANASRVVSSKVRGANVVTKPGFNWNHLWSEWDWNNWIRPQIDRAAALGLNAVRFIALPWVIFATTESMLHPSWAGSTAYSEVGRVRKNGTRLYRVTTAGTSASSGGPTGTGSSITDGTVVWSYVRLANLAPLTQAQFDARWAQFVEYCAQKSLMVYPVLCTTEDFAVVGASGDFQDSSLTASIVTTAQALSAYDNVIAFDVFQEGDTYTGYDWLPSTVYPAGFPVNKGGKRYVTAAGGTSAASGGPTGTGSSIVDGTVTWAYEREVLLPADVYALMNEIREVSSKPLTTSTPGYGAGNRLWHGYTDGFTSLWHNIYAHPDGPDFIDAHMYATDVTAEVVAQLAYSYNKPVMIGEYGIFGWTPGDWASLATQYSRVARTHNMTGCTGSLAWGLAQMLAGDPYLWDNTGFVQANELGAGSPMSTTSGQSPIVESLSDFAVHEPLRQTIINPEITDLELTDPVLVDATLENPSIKDASGNTALALSSISGTTSAVNHVELKNAATGMQPIIQASGSDTNVPIDIRSKNAGPVSIYTGVNLVHAFRNGGTNYLYSDGASTGNAPAISAVGSDSNINLALAPKGTGKVTVGGVEVPTISSTNTLTNKSISLGNNTVTGTTAQFNTALTDGDFVTQGGALGTPSSGTLTNCTFPTLNQSTTGSAASLTTARKINGTSFNGTADVTVGSDLPRTQQRVATNRASTVSGSNHTVYQRVMGAGSISKIGVWVKVSSGNISVSVYSNSGVGSAAVPASRQATSGSVACPAAGYAEISLGSTVDVKDGDWMAISADNVTATFACPLADSGTFNDWGKGIQCAQASAHPSPATPSSLSACLGYDIGLKGIA